MNVQLIEIPVKADRLEEVRAWITGLRSRKEEVLEAVSQEGLADEAVFLREENGRHSLLLYSRASDIVAAAEAFRTSELPVDIEFRRLMADCLELERARPLEKLFAADVAAGLVS